MYTHVDIAIHTHTHAHTHTHTRTAQSSLWYEGRRLVISSDEFPLNHAHPSRLSSIKTPPKFYLFDDAFVIVQVRAVQREIIINSGSIKNFVNPYMLVVQLLGDL